MATIFESGLYGFAVSETQSQGSPPSLALHDADEEWLGELDRAEAARLRDALTEWLAR